MNVAAASDQPRLRGNKPRSRDILLDALGDDEQTRHLNWAELLSVDFEEIETMVDQILFVHHLVPEVSATKMIRLFMTSTTTFLKHLTTSFTRVTPNEATMKRGNRALTTNEDDAHLISWLRSRQRKGNCVTPKEARAKMAKIVRESSGKIIVFDRNWWYRFKNTHKISVAVCSSLEKERSQLTATDCNFYLSKLRESLPQYTASFIFNMDETGFMRRFEKASYRSCVFFKDVETKPRFVEKADIHHFSLIGCISADGESTKPHLISTRIYFPSDMKHSYLPSEFNYSCTSKGYLNKVTMVEWLNKTFVPHVKEKKARLNYPENAPVLLIFDGLKAHIHEQAAEIMHQNNINYLLLPAHSSHIFQPLDLVIFGKLKLTYANSEVVHADITDPFSRKTDRILESWRRCTYKGDIISAWKKAGFDYTYDQDGKVSIISLNSTKCTRKIQVEVDSSYGIPFELSEPQSEL